MRSSNSRRSSTTRCGCCAANILIRCRHWRLPSGWFHAPDITRLLDKLDQRGLIARERLINNRRVVNVRITEAGLLLLSELDEPVRECHERQLGHLNAEQVEILIGLLRIVRQAHEDEGSHWL